MCAIFYTKYFQDIHDVVHNSLMLSPRGHKQLSSSQSNSMKNLHHQQHHSPAISQKHSHSQQNMTFDQQTLMQQHQQAINQHHLMSNFQQDMKSRSVSRLPGIKWEILNSFSSFHFFDFTNYFFSVYPSQNDDTLQIPVGNSTGSLPDLTLVHYQQSPLSTPIDLEHEQLIAVNTVRIKSVIKFWKLVLICWFCVLELILFNANDDIQPVTKSGTATNLSPDAKSATAAANSVKQSREL